MFQLFLFLGILGLLLYCFLPRYLLITYRRYRGDCYWREVRPYKKRYSSNCVVLMFLALGLEISELNAESIFYLFFIAILLSLSWLDLKLRILPDELLLLLALGGLNYHYFVLNSSFQIHLVIVLLWGTCAKISQVLLDKLANSKLKQGFGAGDVKLILALLCCFDGQMMLYLLFIACCLALSILMLSRVFSNKAVESIAFGPFLSVAAYIVWWYG